MEVRRANPKEWWWADKAILFTAAKHIDAAAFRIYCFICNYADNDDQTCYPSIDTLMSLTGSCKKSVSHSIQVLKWHNIITVEKFKDPMTGQWQKNLYTLLHPNVWSFVASYPTKKGIKLNPGVLKDTLESRGTKTTPRQATPRSHTP